MRNIRARRRFRIILILLLVVSAIAFFENRVEALAPQLKVIAEERIERIFGENIDISIGNMSGGIVRPLALGDVRILSKGQKESSRIFWIKSVVSNYRIWDLVWPDYFREKPRVTINFETKNRELAGFIALEGSVDNASIRGHVSVFDGEKIEVRGRLKNGIARLIFRPASGLARVESNFAADGVLLVNIKVSHFKVRSLDISGDVTLKNIAVKSARGEGKESFEGEIEAKNVLVDYKPFFDLKASYKASSDLLEIPDLNIGNFFRLNGTVGLKEPHLVDITAVTDNMNLQQVLSIIDTRSGSFVSGVMNSKWELKGAPENLKTRIRLDIRAGRIGEMVFEYLSASLKGDGSIMSIEDSRIIRDGGPLVLGGEMDLRRIGKDSIFEYVKILSGENSMAWDEWATAKWQDVREFKMTKNVAGGFNIGFTKFVNDDKIDESFRDRDQLEFGYNLHPNDSIKVKFRDNSSFFGLEHKDKF